MSTWYLVGGVEEKSVTVQTRNLLRSTNFIYLLFFPIGFIVIMMIYITPHRI